MTKANPPSSPASAPKPLNIFRPGRHTTMSGQSIDFSEADVQATVAAYKPALHEAPLVVGHPQMDAPAYGWVQTLAYSEGGIDATPAQVNTDFADMVAAGAFKKISASFYSPDSPGNPVPGVYYLRHVGFLGAAAPAVKGLRNPSFADDEAGVLTFGELPVPQFSTTPQELTVTEEEAARLRAENAALAESNAALQAQAAATRKAGIHDANTAFAEGLLKSGQMLPAAVPVMVATMDHLACQDAPVEFGEGDTKAPLLDCFKLALAAAPKQVEFGEAATRERAAGDAAAPAATESDADAQFAESADPARFAQHKAVQAYMAEHKTDYATAARAVIK